MTRNKLQERPTGVRLLSLLLAALIWLAVAGERQGELRLQASVHPEQLPPGLRCGTPAPAKLEMVVAGPRIRLLLLPLRNTSCRLDLSHTSAGVSTFAPQRESFDLDPELKVVRLFPSTVSLTLEQTSQP
jgi:hypothetical protein